jgi:putative SOS response-associated peptidase YedK
VCFRYSAKKNEARIRYREKIEAFGMVPHEDIRPTDFGPILLPEEDSLVLREMRWGWAVPWDKTPLVNAKSETLTTLATFKPHLANRCLLLADGFYEKGIFFRQPDAGIFCIAGLWRKEGDGEKYTMLTTTPNDSVSPHHHRMPLIVLPEYCGDWLGPDWERVLAKPDKNPLEKFQKQPELF